jgi:chemotaxis protein MotB
MAKMTALDDEDIGKPGKPPKQRRFPWRLWLWALVATAAAGGGGYFAWYFYNESKDATEANKTAQATALDATTKLAGEKQRADECTTKRDDLSKENTRLAKDHESLSKNLKASGEELTQLRAQQEETKKRLAAIEEIQKLFAKMIDTGALKVSARRGSLVLSLPAEVLFPSGVAELSKDGEIKVLEVGFHLKKFNDRRFLVIGHSDNQPLKPGAFKDNLDLSAQRALTVTRHLIQAGMDPKNLLPSGSGDSDPLVPNNSAANMARNRRIEIALMPAISELPPLPAGLDKDAAGKDTPKKP